mmetsp:Transcript_25363/g.66842  ORF Transcript_25363/g.66842 Transcript_25363/m.66842 type:complete len:359 (+) Transcript_25363:367-1443(+)
MPLLQVLEEAEKALDAARRVEEELVREALGRLGARRERGVGGGRAVVVVPEAHPLVDVAELLDALVLGGVHRQKWWRVSVAEDLPQPGRDADVALEPLGLVGLVAVDGLGATGRREAVEDHLDEVLGDLHVARALLARAEVAVRVLEVVAPLLDQVGDVRDQVDLAAVRLDVVLDLGRMEDVGAAARCLRRIHLLHQAVDARAVCDRRDRAQAANLLEVGDRVPEDLVELLGDLVGDRVHANDAPQNLLVLACHLGRIGEHGDLEDERVLRHHSAHLLRRRHGGLLVVAEEQVAVRLVHHTVEDVLTLHQLERERADERDLVPVERHLALLRRQVLDQLGEGLVARAVLARAPALLRA